MSYFKIFLMLILVTIFAHNLKNINMSNGFYNVPIAINEPVKDYSKGSAERSEVLR